MTGYQSKKGMAQAKLEQDATMQSLKDLARSVCDEVGKAAFAQPAQEPVAWGVFEGNLHDMFFTEAEAVEMAQLKGTHAEVKPLYTKEKNT